MSRSTSPSSPPTVVELFCGCGGMSCGLLRAGYNVKLGIDWNEAAVDTFEFNHAHVGARGWSADLSTTSGSDILDRAGVKPKKLDLLVGGPPCQPFSIIGKRQGLADSRGTLVLEYLRLVTEIEPRAFIFENVPSFATADDGKIAERLLRGFKNAGYATTHGVLNAAEFGVPQNRRRFFIVGVRGEKAPGFPQATHGDAPLLGLKPVKTCKDALGDLPDVDTEEALEYANHEGTCHSPAMIKMFEDLKPGERDPKSHHDRLEATKPSYVLRAGNGNFSPLRPIHYKFHRVVSVRESARIQGFPDHFAWPDDMSRLQQYRQVGNAVPPPLAEAIGRHLARQLGWHLEPDTFAAEPGPRERLVAMTVEERIARRKSYIRGASVGRTG